MKTHYNSLFNLVDIKANPFSYKKWHLALTFQIVYHFKPQYKKQERSAGAAKLHHPYL